MVRPASLPLVSLAAVAVALAWAACASAPAAPVSLITPDLAGWHFDVPAADQAKLPSPFVVRDGVLVSMGKPEGHLITDASYRDYRLRLEWRWPGEPGNCGVLVHSSTPRKLYGMFPQSIECQLHATNAGDFW